MVHCRVQHHAVASLAELYHWLEPGELLAGPPAHWAADWTCADPDRFGQAAVRA
jgi:hypothetical protein